MGGLKYGETPTGVIFGFLSYIPSLQKQFNTEHVAFCWDSKTNLRKHYDSRYKGSRETRLNTIPPDEQKFEVAFRTQMKKLRRVYLKTIGFRNVFVQPGYESDDIIASLCLWSKEDDDRAVIVTSDHDLFQMITPTVSVYNPIKSQTMTLQRFKKEYGIHPKRWAQVKAIGGCSGDNVYGVRCVGEKTALKYLRGELKTSSKAYERIKETAGCITISRNLRLVRLPFEDVKIFKLRKDKVTEEGWGKVCKKLGMKSLRNKLPFGERKRR
jgi:5'-3' exonuclease